MAGIQGSLTSATSGTSVTLPATGLMLIAIGCQKHTIGGYISIPIDGTKNAILPFSAQRGVTTLDVPVNQALPGGMWLVTLKMGLKLNYTGTGLTSGNFFFYYGTPFSTAMQTTYPLNFYQGVEVDVTTSTSLSFTFPGGPIVLRGMCYEAGYNTAETNVATDFSFNTGAGISIDINVNNKDPLQFYPMDNLKAAQSLTVTAAFDGTHVATGRLVVYYDL